MIKKISLYVLVILYVGAGINHFINRHFYVAIMPPYIPVHAAMVALSGVAEIILGLALIPVKTRKWAAHLIALMLIIFIPVHIFMLQQAYTVENYSTTIVAAWIRLLLQPLLIIWVLWHSKELVNQAESGIYKTLV